MTPYEILEAARELLKRPDLVTAGIWPRASAFLARQALEDALDELWRRNSVTEALTRCSMATQMTCLPLMTDADLAHDAYYAWVRLSSACHYHPYELPPTAAELSRWFDLVERAIGRLVASEPRTSSATLVEPCRDGG